MTEAETDASSVDTNGQNKLKNIQIFNADVGQNGNIFPHEIQTLEKIMILKEQLDDITWEKEGIALLQKNSFNDYDKKIYKLLLMKEAIPKKYRGEFWYISSGGKRELLLHPNYYKYLLEQYPKNISQLDEIGTQEQIEKDLNRTFPGEKFFKEEKNIIKLRNILTCYFNRNLSGYTQGCNFIVGRLLEFIGDEEKVFWTFSQLMEEILTVDYFSQMLGVYVEVDILMCLLKELYTPSMIEHLQKADKIIYLQNILLQWFISLFIIKFPKKMQLIIWDLFFIEKKIVLFKVSISLLVKYKNKIKKIESMETLKYYLDETFNNFSDSDYLKYILFIKHFEFNDEFLNINRQIFIEQKKKLWEKDKINKINAIKQKLNDREDFCNTNWPYCIYDSSLKYRYNDTLIYSQSKEINIIEDYFSPRNKNLLKNKKINFDKNLNDNLTFDNILIERLPHCCEDYNKNLSFDVESIDESKDSDNSSSDKNSSEEQFKNEIDENYYEKKNKYKRMRKMSCINSLAFFKKFKENHKFLGGEFNNKDRNSKDYSEIDKFLSKGFYNYSKYSLHNFCSLVQLPSNFLSNSNI